MRKLWCLLALMGLVVPFCAHFALAAPNEADSVRSVVAAFATDWNQHDMEAFGRLFARDADFVNVTGFLMKGRQEIQAHHSWAHGAIPESTRIPGALPRNYGIFKNSTMKFDEIDVRFLGNDVALAHVKWELFHDARTSVPRRGILLFVLTRRTQEWKIVSAQNTEINRSVK